MKKILAFLLATVMLITFALPVSAQDIVNITDYGESADDSGQDAASTEEAEVILSDEPPTEDTATTPTAPTEDTGGDPATDQPDFWTTRPEVEPDAGPVEAPTETEPAPALGESGDSAAEPTEAELIAAMEEWLNSQRLVRPRMLRAAPGDTGSIQHSTISIRPYDVTVPGVGRAYGSVIWKMNINGETAFCLEIWKLAGGTYTAGDATSGNGQTAQYIANYMASGKGNAEYVATQVLVWESLYGDIGIYDQSIRGTNYESAYNAIKNASADVAELTYWSSSSNGQDVVTYASGEEPPPDDGGEDEQEEEEGNPDTHTEVTTESSTRTEIRSTTEYEYADGIGQITIAKRDQDGKSLDGAIFNIVVEFANGDKGGDSAFEIYNGSRLFTYTHPIDDYSPARVTVTEVRPPDGYIADPTPKTAIVHPTYTRITKILTHTITITTTTTTSTTIDIESGEVLSESEASADSETELDPPTVQEYTDFIEGDRETTLTFVNNVKAAELVIFKYTTGKGTPLRGAQFEVSYVDPTVHSGRWTVTTGADGKATIALPKPGAILVHEVNPPAGHIISPTYGPDTTVTIYAGERKQVDIPNDPYTAVEVLKIDSVTGEPLAGATISIKNVTSGMEFRKVTGANGIALFENVEPGAWYAEEIKAPDRYVLNTTRYPVELKSNETATVTIPNDPYTGIEVTKVDANNGQKLAGAYIRLKHIDSGQEYSGMTGADGKVYFGLIPPGDYYAEEIQPPHGYVLNDTRYPLELQAGELATLTIGNYRKDGLYIRKVDENGEPIAGAVFELRRGSGEVLLRETTDANGLIYRGFLTTDTYIAEEVQAPEGFILDENNPQSIFIDETDDNKEYVLTFVNKRKPSIEIVKIDAANPNIHLQGAVFRVSEQGGSKSWDVTTGFDGRAVLENLEIGTTYVIEEKTAPAGYVNEGFWDTVILNECRIHTVTVTNGQRPGLRIEKVNEATGNKLPGAVFRVSRREGNYTADSVALSKATWGGGSEYTDVTTGIDGTVTLENLAPGWYEISEIRAPSGYVLDATPREIELVAGDGVAVITVNNNRDPELTIRKIDEQTLAGLEGVTLRVTRDGASEYRDVTTGPNGVITLPLSPGWYFVQERVAKPGYQLDDTVHTIELKPGVNSEIVITNRKQPSLKIIKLCAVTGNPLQATFEIKIKNGRALGTFTTDPETGELFLPNLEYTSDPLILEITETRAPDGYIPTSEPMEVTIGWGEDKVIQWPNTPENPILIYKRDVDGNPIGNVEFAVTTVNGAHAVTVKTDRTSGVAVVPGLAPGWYTVRETRTGGEEYILDSTPKQVELKPGVPATVEFINDKRPMLQIIKRNKADNKPMPGVLVRVSYMNGERIGDYRTNAAGIITIAADAGWVTVYELETLQGFVLDQTPVNAELKPNKTATVELYNEPVPGLQLRKSCSVSGKPLAGVQYKFTRLDGGVIGTFTTDAQGIIYLDINEPSVIIAEIKTVDGYRLDNVPRTVELAPGELTVVAYENTPFPVLEIIKLDSLSKEPLANVKYKIFDGNMREVGMFPTNSLGRIVLTCMEEGKYYLQEVDASAAGPYVLDKTVYEVNLFYGKTTKIELFNTRMGTLRIRKISAETGQPLAGAVYLLYDARGNTLGEYKTDSYGVIELDSSIEPQKITLKEIKAPEGFVLDDTVYEAEIKAGETAEITLENEPERGRIQITKTAAAANAISNDKAGAKLEGAEFEIINDKREVVEVIVTDSRGVAESGDLPLGRYAIRETAAPEFYLLDDSVFYADIKLDGDLIRFEVQNDPADIAVTVEKRGDDEAKVGEVITYEFSNISNTSNIPLEEFYLHDALPAEARLEMLTTGTWSERLTYKVVFRTNLKQEYRTWAGNLLTTVNNQLSVSDLRLSEGEYVTDFKLIFGTVEPGFREQEKPTVTARVLEDLENETRIVNKADAGGRVGSEWAYGTDSWVTVTQGAGPKKPLPKTGLQ